MLNIVYPYVESGWDELRYSLRSLEQHLKEDFTVTIIGDYLPPWIRNVNYIKTPRYTPANVDTGSKLRLCSILFDSFLWMNDDIYLARDTTLENLKVLRAKEVYSNKSHRGATAWVKFANASYAAVKQAMPECDLFNYVTHTPFFIESDKLITTDQVVPIFDGSHDAIICYFNITATTRPKKLSGHYTFPVPFTPPTTEVEILNHAENALTAQAKEYLQMRFYTPSRFEETAPTDTPAKVCVKYIGMKQGYKYGRFDFTDGYTYMPTAEARKLVAMAPRSFVIG